MVARRRSERPGPGTSHERSDVRSSSGTASNARSSTSKEGDAPREFLELDHIVPRARGGTDDAADLRVVCRMHNLREAERAFGRAYVEERIRFGHGDLTLLALSD